MIRRSAKLGIVLPLTVWLLSGCFVAVRPVAPCLGGVWIEGHYDRVHRWRPAHWRCPGIIEEEIIIR